MSEYPSFIMLSMETRIMTLKLELTHSNNFSDGQWIVAGTPTSRILVVLTL